MLQLTQPFTIRPLRQSETPLLADFLYEAIFQTDLSQPLPRSILQDPALRVYIDNFNRSGDICLAAEIDGQVVGAIWARIFFGDTSGFGTIDSETPELAMSVLEPYRKRGIGTALLTVMLSELKKKGYQQVSLSVQKKNYALRMYQKAGFQVVRTSDEDLVMVCALQKDADTPDQGIR